ncbi:MAG: hypothetical protein IJU44_04170 [Kiritimatiellae bacterium]|nr:hypothetical protein [Kiritimatiellia bacterium]
MKKTPIFLTVVTAVGISFAQGPGRQVYKPGFSTPPPQGEVRYQDYNRNVDVSRDVYDRTPGGGHVSMTPIAFGFGTFGMPHGRNWAVCGLRVNFGLPEFTTVYEAVYGVDVGLSGETNGESGGVLVNLLNNTTRDMYGIGVAGLWNRSTGMDSHALQVAVGLNSAEKIDGIQIALVNRAQELHGVQIGIYNQAMHGGGLQIGLWNDNGRGCGTPIIGIAY